MSYSIIGSANVGSALARLFEHKKMDVAIANSRGPNTLASLTKKLGPSVVPQTREDVKTLFEFGELDDYVSFGGKA
jgi:8-hydroxy-5-deazaflavin:NADPH oxidoreductase